MLIHIDPELPRPPAEDYKSDKFADNSFTRYL
jgi:hypothetical protein